VPDFAKFTMKKVLFLSILFCLVLSISGALAQGGPRPGGTLIFGRGGDAVTLDPARFNESESGKVARCIYEGLVKFNEDLTEIQPSLATSWNVSDNGKVWVFNLRKGVSFHDGTHFNANAVVTSYRRQFDPQHPFYNKDFFKLASHTFRYVTKVEATDEHTVKITMEKPFAPFLNILAIAAASFIVSPTALEKWGDQIGRHPVGTGPFRFDKWIPGERITLERNPNYWGNKPYLDRLVFVSIADNKSRLLALKTSAIHVMDGIDPGMVSEMTMVKGVKLSAKDGHNVSYLAMNTEKKPFDQLKVRQAVNHAINKKKLIRLVYQDLAVPAKNPVPPSMWGYNDAIADYDYNPKKAKEMLKEAGYEKGFKTTLWIASVARPYMPEPKKMADLIQRNLAAVGITARIVTDDFGKLLNKTANGEHDMYLGGWSGSNGDPNSFLYVLLDSDNAVKPKALNYAFFRNEAVHELLAKAQQSFDRQTRTGLYRQAQEVIHRQAPWVPLAHNKQMVAFHERVHGLVQLPTGVFRFDRVWME
jgi:peptide/nickel transport system substrate-binding protein